MNFSAITNAASKAGRFLNQHSPEILTVTGIALGVGATVVAVKQTPKAMALVEQYKENMQAIKFCTENCSEEEYSKEDAKKDKIATTTQVVVGVAKTYAAPLTMTALAIVSELTALKIMRRRNLALGVALATTTKAYKTYRNRVKERFGEEVENEIYTGKETHTEVVEEVDKETGEVKKVEKEVTTYNTQACPMAFFFDEYNDNWVDDAEMNNEFVFQNLKYCQEIYDKKGYLYGNTVNRMFGVKDTALGQRIGMINPKFIKDPEARARYIKEFMPDEFISFGFDMLSDEPSRAFINKEEKSVLINPNYHGDITEYLQYL